MRRPSRAGLSLVLALCAGIPLSAQNLGSLGKEKPFSFSGGLSLNQIFYGSAGVTSRRDPYSYVASGNLSLSLYGWSIPLRFTFANNQTTFSQPFNQYAVHPTWKWITAHAGYTSLSFSPYTVNGHIFLGGALELSPGNKWKVSALYGRFLKAVAHDSATQVPSFQRMGYGLKATYGNNADFIEWIVFAAQDQRNSIAPLPDSLHVRPQQNLVASLGGGKSILKHFLLKAELAVSALTRDTRVEESNHAHPLANMGSLFAHRLSSAYYRAFRSSLDYRKDSWALGVGFEKIDPGYSTLGAYYFNNDLENITLNGSAALLKGKLNLAGSTGMQRDNLDQAKASTMRRMVASLNLSYTPSAKMNLSANYSSFQTFTNIRSQFEAISQLSPYDNLDTLTFTQISRNASLSGMYTLSASESRRQQVTVQLSWQDAADKQGEADQHAGTRFYNFNAGYGIAFLPQNMNVSVNFNTSINDAPFIQTRAMGPTTSVTRSFAQRKFRTTLSASFNETYSQGVKVNAVTNARWSGMFTMRKKHNLNISAVIVRRVSGAETTPRSVSEFTGTIGYNYSFQSNADESRGRFNH